MIESDPLEPVFSYMDYRKYLGDFYTEQKAKHPYFSYRYLADKAGFKTKDFLYRVIRGEKNLSQSSVFKISHVICHTRNEAEYFENLVGFNQARSIDEREHFYHRLELLSKQYLRSSKPRLVTHDLYKVFSEWYHLVVRSLIDMYEFTDDFDWLAHKVYPPVSAAQARKSVELLEQLGFICKDNTGMYRVTEKSITTGEDVKVFALQSFYRAGMKLASDAMDKVPRDRRNVSGLTLGLSADTYAEIVRRIQSFRKEIMELADRDLGADRVCQLNFMLFPVSAIDDKDGNEDDSKS